MLCSPEPYSQVYFEVKKSIGESFTPDVNPDTVGYVNQHGLSRKVSICALFGLKGM